jgi:CheY-like chemotaxis protein
MSNPHPAEGKGQNSNVLIYVVDDEPMLLELATAILEPQGYDVKPFRDPEIALQSYAAAQPQPDLLITDYAMHTMNGMDLMKQFRKVNPQQKVLLVSGTVAEDIFADSPIKPDRFLAKPYQAAQLNRIVKELLAA